MTFEGLLQPKLFWDSDCFDLPIYMHMYTYVYKTNIYTENLVSDLPGEKQSLWSYLGCALGNSEGLKSGGQSICFIFNNYSALVNLLWVIVMHSENLNF